MKKLLLIIISLLLFSCKTREKAVSKSETETLQNFESTAKIQRKTLEFNLDKSIFSKEFRQKFSSEENLRNEKKNVDKGKEYYENGNLKKEWERDLSELSESNKKIISELEEKINIEKESSKYWSESSDMYYNAWQKETEKTKSYEMQLKAKDNIRWYLIVLCIVLGAFLPTLFRIFKSWLFSLNPVMKLIEKYKN